MSDIGSIPDISEGRFCPDCGYDLRGINSGRCPECGAAVDRSTMGTSVIPWTHRRSIGRVRAYLRTVKLAILHPARLAHEISRSANLSDAKSFRLVTTILAAAPVAAMCTWFFYMGGWVGGPGTYYLELGEIAVSAVCIFIFFLTTAGVASYWFSVPSQEVQQQDRAIAISYYACAALALTPIAMALMCGAIAAIYLNDPMLSSWSLSFAEAVWIVGLAGLGLLLAEFALVLFSAARLLNRATHCSLARRICCWVGLPIAWISLAGIFLIGLPLAYIFVALMALSFH